MVNKIKFYTKTLISLNPYHCIRLSCNSKTNHICIYLQILKRNKKVEKLNCNESKQILQRLKINGCAICGYNKCKSALEFHHVIPKDKKFLIGKTFISGHCNEKIAEELNKCVLLCSNCHREIHNKEKVNK